MDQLSGRCLCGGVSFSFPNENLKTADACHCSQCRRWSGFFWGSVNAPFGALHFDDDKTLKWFRATKHARRGFCGTCGASLFWQGDNLDGHKTRIAIALGALNEPHDIKIEEHIFVANKGSYYELADGLPQKDVY